MTYEDIGGRIEVELERKDEVGTGVAVELDEIVVDVGSSDVLVVLVLRVGANVPGSNMTAQTMLHFHRGRLGETR